MSADTIYFLKTMGCPRAAAMGGANVASSDPDGKNPAGIDGEKAGLAFASPYNGMATYSNVFYANKVLGIKIDFLNIGDIERTDADGTVTGSSSVNDYRVAIPAMILMSEKAAFGITTNILNESLNKNGEIFYMCFDAGFRASLKKELHIGVLLENVLAPEMTEPLSLTLGVAWNPQPAFTIEYDGRFSTASEEEITLSNMLGIEYLILKDSISIRGGVAHDVNVKGAPFYDIKPSCGLGINVSDLSLDLAYQLNGILPGTFMASIKYNLEAKAQ